MDTALLFAGTAFALVGCGSATQKAANSSQPTVRVGALVVTIPAGFHRYEISRHRQLIGIVVTDYRVKPGSATLAKGMFPPTAVVLSIGRGTTRIALSPLRLPLSLNELRGPQRHSDGASWNGTFGLRGSYYAISFWAGRKAAARDRLSLNHVLRSIQAVR